MAKTTEQKTVLTVEGKITRVNILDGGKSVEIFSIPDCTQNQNETKEKSFDERFPIVRASTLSLKDSFLKHKPQTNQQKRLKESITAGIKAGLKDFRCPAMDPSFDNDGNIIYKEGERPAVGKSPRYWKSEMKKFMPEKNSRMGSLVQRDAFLCLLIKYLIEEKGYKVADAWKAVCDDSRDLGHYCNSENAKGKFEPTGSRKVWEFYDLANTCKIVTDENSASGFSLVGGYYDFDSDCYPLSDVDAFCNPNVDYFYGVVWLVLDV